MGGRLLRILSHALLDGGASLLSHNERTAVNKADIKALRAARRNHLIAEGALVDAYKSTRSRSIPSAKRYKRTSKHRTF